MVTIKRNARDSECKEKEGMEMECFLGEASECVGGRGGRPGSNQDSLLRKFSLI